MKNLKLRMLSLGVAVTMPFVSCHMSKVHAEETDWTMASYMEENLENDDIDSIRFEKYTVVKNDNASRISMKLYGDSKYWPVIAFFNDYPRIIHPGDELKYPRTVEAAEIALSYIKSIGWYDMYVIRNNIYGTGRTIGDVMDDIYGEDASSDPKVVEAFCRLMGLNPNNFNAGTYVYLTGEYPSFDMVLEESEKTKQK